jgi:hypothetical protein
MNTEQFIGQLTADLANSPTRPARPFWAHLLIATAAASIPTGFVILLVLSRSPHLAHGIGPTIAFTLASALALAAGSFWTAFTTSRPEAEPRRGWLVVPGLILFAGIGLELARVPATTWSQRLMGDNPLACFSCVFVLSLPILAGTLFALRQGAPSRPKGTGAIAGLLAGGVTAALYTIHCPEDSLLFIAAWHIPAIALVSLIGAAAGTRVLRW